MTRYTTINHREVAKGRMTASAIEQYCKKNGLTQPDVFAVQVTADYVNRRPFNWETKAFDFPGYDSDPYGEMGGDSHILINS